MAKNRRRRLWMAPNPLQVPQIVEDLDSSNISCTNSINLLKSNALTFIGSQNCFDNYEGKTKIELIRKFYMS